MAIPRSVAKARSRLITKHPFFGSLALKLNVIVAEDGTALGRQINTMAVDGKNLYVNREWSDALELDQCKSVLAHEVLHVALKHHLRRGEREPKRWNAACDFAINLILKRSGLFDLPEPHLLDHKYDGMSAEEIYEKLLEEHPIQPDEDGTVVILIKNGDGEDVNPGDLPGEVWDAVDPRTGKKLTPSQVMVAEREINANIMQAAQAEKSVGQGSLDHVREVVDNIVEVNINWYDVLAELMLRTKFSHHTYSRLNKRMQAIGYKFPTEERIPEGNVVFAIDTSGSVTAEELGVYQDHCRRILSEFNPDSVVVIYCDWNVNHVDEFEAGEEVEFEMHGGGGTAFHPPFNKVAEMGLEPDVLVYFTDGYGSVQTLDEGTPDYPVIWATTGTEPSFYGGEEFGEILEVDLSKELES